MPQCPYCPRAFADENGLWMHARSKHPREKTAHLRPEPVDESMGPIFRAMKEEARERKSARVGAIAETLQRFRDAGASVELVNPQAHHYRITAARGEQYDFWGSTERWLRMGTNQGGGGARSLLSRL